jgi:ribonuclease HI
MVTIDNEVIITAFVDGSSRGNPGFAGIGIALFAEGCSEPVEEISKSIGTTTNNVAEYEAVITALKWFLDHRVGTAVIKLDSELVYKQLVGEYRVKTDHILTLVKRAHNLMNQLKDVSIVLIPREMNKWADRLAQKASKVKKTPPTAKTRFIQGKIAPGNG